MNAMEKDIVEYLAENGTLPENVTYMKKTYKLDHISTARGYQKKGTAKTYKYEGRFGKGYMIDFNNPNSSYFKNRAYYLL